MGIFTVPRRSKDMFRKYVHLCNVSYPVLTSVCAVDFALTEAAYAVFRILEKFPDISLPPGEKVELVGVEKQTITLVISIAEGCNVKIQ